MNSEYAQLNLKQKIVRSDIESRTITSIEKCGKRTYEFKCWTCDNVFTRRAYCKVRYHNDETCFESRKRRILQQMGITNVLSCPECGYIHLDFYENQIVCKRCGEIYTGKKRLKKLKWRKKYSNYRRFFGKMCKFLTISASKKVFLQQYKKKRSEFLKKLRNFLYYLRHPDKLSDSRKKDLKDKGHERFKKGYNFYAVGVIDQSFKKEGGELKIENGLRYCNLQSHMAIAEKGSDKYPINRKLLKDLWKVLFKEKPHNLWIERKETDVVFEYLAKRGAGRLGDYKKKNIHYLSDVLSPGEYDFYFRNTRIFRAYGIQKKLVCEECGRVYDQKEKYNLCPECKGLIKLSLIPWNYDRENHALRVLVLLRGNNRLDICPKCGSPDIELCGILEDGVYIHGKPPPPPPEKRNTEELALDNRLDRINQELEKNQTVDISYAKKQYGEKFIRALLKKGLLIRSGSKVFFNLQI